jgi:protein TonB
MLDDTDPPARLFLPWLRRIAGRLGTGWSALILFGLALLLGVIAGAVWIKTHPAHPASVATGPVMTPDPIHPPLPTPSAGGVSTLPPPGAAPEAPPIEPAPSESVSAPESTDGDFDSDTTADAPSSAAAPTEASQTAGDSDPQVIERSQPEYPSDALQAHEEGKVQLQVKLDATGAIEEIRVTNSSGSHSLDRAAIDAARSWRYRPGRRNGEAAPGTADVSVDFSLGEH